MNKSIIDAMTYAKTQSKSNALHNRPTAGSLKTDIKKYFGLSNLTADSVVSFGIANTPFTFEGFTYDFTTWKLNK